MTDTVPRGVAARLSETLKAKTVEARDLMALVGHRFAEERCLRMAASLSYTSLLAIVPLTAIAFSMLAAFPVFEGIRGEFQEILFSNFLPQSADAMREYFDQFVKNTTRLTAVGIVGLAATAVLLLGTIEADLNTIFRVGRARALAPRLLVFWALITLGPLLLGASFSLSTYFFALTRWMGAEAETVSDSVGVIAGFLPTFIVIVALTLCYIVVPNRRVRLRDAVVGGIVAGLLFALLRRGFGVYVAKFPTYQTIYGAVSVVPIFLVWMYLSWAVVLLGAILTAVLGEWRAGIRAVAAQTDCGQRLIAAIDVLSTFLRASRAGRGVSRDDVLKASGLDGTLVDRLLVDFQRHGYADRTQHNDWVLVRDLSSVTLYDLMRFLDVAIEPVEVTMPSCPWRARLTEELAGLARLQKDAAAMPLRDLLDVSEAPKDEAATPTVVRKPG